MKRLKNTFQSKINNQQIDKKFDLYIIIIYFCIPIKKRIMIVIPIKEGENIDRALKRFKRKFEKTGTVKELRARQAFKKPSVKKREQMIHAVYVQHMQQEEI